MGTVFADVNRAAGRVMAHNGIAVEVPVKQQCCGALQVHSGMMDEARVLALKEYGHLLHDDPVYAARARDFSSRVKDVNEYLGSQPIVAPTLPVLRTVTYQEPCHLAHAQRVTVEPRTLLKSIKGVELIEMKESSLCCGSAGIYNILRKDFADRLGDRKVENTKATGASTVVTANPGCFLQLRSTLKRNGADMDVKYIVELLDEAYGGPAATEWAIDRSTHRSS
jgi:glycolate oxidase iron-sulfur subunit